MSNRGRRRTRQRSPELPEMSSFNVQSLAAAINEVKNDLKSSQERLKNEILTEMNTRLESMPKNVANERTDTSVTNEQPIDGTMSQSRTIDDCIRINAEKDPKMAKFNGNDDDIKIEAFLNIFELLYNRLSDEQKVVKVIAFLEGDAASYFGSDIAVQTPISWGVVKQMLTDRYAHSDISPMIAAPRRRLQRNETIKQYFDEKLRILRRIQGITEAHKC